MKAGFNRPFVTADLPGGEDVWRVEVGFFFRDRDGIKWYCPAGTITDGASIPRFLWGILGHPRDTDIGQPAALHDTLYRRGYITRKRADELLAESMETLGASATKRALVYAGVRMFGGVIWKKYREKGPL